MSLLFFFVQLPDWKHSDRILAPGGDLGEKRRGREVGRLAKVVEGVWVERVVCLNGLLYSSLFLYLYALFVLFWLFLFGCI